VLGGEAGHEDVGRAGVTVTVHSIADRFAGAVIAGNPRGIADRGILGAHTFFSKLDPVFRNGN
jgi:hypothetical protein